jgi:hypothetical protein
LPRRCKACTDPDHQHIDRWIVEGRTIKDVSEKFGISITALYKHRAHIATRIQQTQERIGESVLDDVRALFPPVTKLFTACDEYLRDPDNPEKYALGPRDTDILVTYLDTVEDPETGEEQIVKNAKPKRAMLSQLLDKTGKHILGTRYNIADPRELVLKAAEAADKLLSHIGRLTGQEKPGDSTINVQINLYDIMPAIMATLDLFPEARQAVLDSVSRRINAPKQIPG